MWRNLQEPRDRGHNIRVYDNDGALLASMGVIPSDPLYITGSMLYRYCSHIFTIPSYRQWAFHSLLDDGSVGGRLQDNETPVQQGNLIVLDQESHNPITVSLTTENAPRRVTTRTTDDRSRGQRERNSLQRRFRDRLQTRDDSSTFNPDSTVTATLQEFAHMSLQAAHIFPTSQVSRWHRENWKQYTDEGPADEIGETRLYSPQNGLLLGTIEHSFFDHFGIGVDPDANFMIVCFIPNNMNIAGRRLKDSAIQGANGIPGVSPPLLRWHLRMCVLAHMKANAESQNYWEDDLGDDPIGQILEQPDAGERMEIELFTRLGAYVA